MILLAPRVHRAVPGSLGGVVLATLVVEAAGAQVPRIGELPHSLPAPALPTLDLPLLGTLSGAAFAVALLAAIESLLSARVAASMAGTGSYNPDRELVGQGLASMASGLFGGMHTAVFRLDGAMFFGAADRLVEAVERVHGVVILRMSQLNILDASGAHALAEIIERLEARGVTVLLKGLQDQHTRLATNVGVLEALRHEHHLFTEMADAVAHARSHVRRATSLHDRTKL